ncbi:MAG: Uncharacterized protein G01um101444_420 [Parcubacteria group bacterium Gr01-1014_44]|nr:MAG: Uncharacterized protein G01um101444_420 [Parcubacteria group bacterium Gr01-1014_44]
MSLRDIEKILVWVIKAGVYTIPFLVLIISGTTFFPFITAKNIFFRIIVEFITAAWIGLLCINRERYWPKWNILSMIFSAFIAAVFLSAAFGVDFANSMWSNFERMEGLAMYFHLAALFFVLSGTFQARFDWFIIFGISIAVSFFVAFYGLLEFLGAVTAYSDGTRIISTLGNPLYVAAYLTFHIFLILFFWFKTNILWLKWLLSALFIFEIVVFFMTGSRGAFLGIIAGFGLFFLLWTIFGIRDIKRRAIFGAVMIFLVLVPFIFISLKDTEFIKGNRVLGRFANISLADNTVQARFTIWKMAIRSFTEHPILGWGPGNFIIPYAKYYDPKMFGNEAWFDRTHNMPLEWLTSGGLSVFLLYLALMGLMAWSFLGAVSRGRLTKRDAYLFVGMIGAYLFQLLFVFDTLPTYIMLIIFLSFASVIKFSEESLWTTGSSSAGTKKSSFGMNPGVCFAVIAASFAAALLLTIFINVKPFRSAQAMIRAFQDAGQGNVAQTKANFEKALRLSSGTVGIGEVREHLARIALSVPADQIQAKPEIKEFFEFAISEMEKETAIWTGEYRDVKDNLVLGQLYGQLGQATQNAGMIRKSFEQYKLAADFAPNYLHIYPLLANAALMIGEPDVAVRSAEKIEELLYGIEKYDDIIHNSAIIYAAVGQFERSLGSLKKLKEVRGGQPDALNHDLVAQAGKVARNAAGQKALGFIEQLLELDPVNKVLKLILAEMYAEVGRIAEARKFALAALEQDPSLKNEVEQFVNALEGAAIPQ